MNHQAEQLLQIALGLDPDDRAELAASLIRSLDDQSAEDIDAASSQEIKRRIESIDTGKVQLVPWDDVIGSMRNRLNA